MKQVNISRIIEMNAPLIFPDTCIFLYILRFPQNTKVKNIDETSIKSAKMISEAVSILGHVVSVIAEQVKVEIAVNLDSVIQNTESELHAFNSKIQNINRWSEELGFEFEIHTYDYSDAVIKCRKILDDWMSASLISPTTLELIRRSNARVSLMRTPSKKGKSSINDCIIVETCLDIASILRKLNFKKDIIFASSNTQEFLDGAKGKLREDIKNEFDCFQINYAWSLQDAVTQLKLLS